MPKRPHKSLADIATRHQVFLERYKAGQVKTLVGIFREVDRNTRDVLSALDDPNIGNLSKRKLTVMLSELEAVNRAAIEKGTGDFLDKMESFAGYEAAFEARSILSVLASPPAVEVPTAAAAYARALAQPISATGDLLSAFVEGWTDGELLRMNQVVQRAWGEGWTNQQLIQAIRGTKALNFKDGILETSRRNADAVARTSIQHVASMGRMKTWEDNADIVSGYTWIATLDGNTTAICRSLDRRKFETGKGPVPPAHIRCRSTTIANLDPELDFLDEGATRSSVDGYVDANLSYYDWLKTQDADFVKEALGATRAKLFLDGGLSADEFARLNLGKNFQPLTLDEMRGLEPLAFKRAGIPNP